MNRRLSFTTTLLLFFYTSVFGNAQDMDKGLSDLAEKLALPITEHSKKKVAVSDFADLQGTSCGELGKYIAEQLTVNLVIGTREFSVLDRANLKSILAEHKLTAKGLVDPENAKKLGMFAGVDALILGTIIPKGTNILLTAKVITTDTATIVGAARVEFLADPTVQDLISHVPAGAKPGTTGENTPLDDPKTVGSDPPPVPEAPKVIKSFGDLRVDLDQLRIVNGNQYLLTMTLTNQNAKKSIWVALDMDPRVFGAKGHITDSSGYESRIDNNGYSGIQPATQTLAYGNGSGYATYEEMQNPHHRFSPAIEIRPRSESTATLKFISSSSKLPESGVCSLQLEFLLGHDFVPGGGTVEVANLVTKLEAH